MFEASRHIATVQNRPKAGNLPNDGGTANWEWRKDYIWCGLLLASRQIEPGDTGPTTYHYHLDHLGTPRRITDSADRIIGVHDYHAFGQELSGGQNEPSLSLMKFTGHERDMIWSDSWDTLDYMHARYYSATLGRFLSIDPADSADLRKPQTWNRYGYGNNSPLRHIDPDGLRPRDIIVVPVTIVLSTPDKDLQHRVQRSLARAQDFFARADILFDVKRVEGSVTWEGSGLRGVVNGPSGLQGIGDFVRSTKGIVVIVGDTGKVHGEEGSTEGIGGPTLLGSATGESTVSDELAHALGNVAPGYDAINDADPVVGMVYGGGANIVTDFLTNVQEARVTLGLGLQTTYQYMLRNAARQIVCPQGRIIGTSGPCD